MKRILKLWDNAFVKGMVSLTLSSVLANFLNYAYSTLAGRMLGPVGYGEITALFSYITILSIPMLVVQTLVIQRVSAADDPHHYALMLEHYLIEKTKQIWPFLALSLLATPFIPALTNLSLLSAAVLIPTIIVSLAVTYYSSLMQGMQMFTLYAVTGLVAALVKLMGAGAAFLIPQRLFAFIIFSVISYLATLIVCYEAFRRAVRNKISRSSSLLHYRLRQLFRDRQFIIASLSLIALTLFSNADIIAAKKFLPEHDAGIYSSWSLFAKIILYIVSPIISVSFVFFAKKDGGGRNRMLLLSIIMLAAVGAAGYVGYTFFAPLLIAIVFGSRFAQVQPYLGQAAIFGALYTSITYINNYFLARSSRASLILPVCAPVYIALLVTRASDIQAIISINIYVSAGVVILYLFASVREFFIVEK